MKQIKRLYERAGITSLGALQQACVEHRLLDVPGFGPKAQEKLQRALGQYHRGQGYHLYANVVAEADVLAAALGTIQGVRAVSVAGAMRRKVEVINELAFVLAVDRRLSLAQLARRVEQIPNMTEVSSHRETVAARSPLGLPVLITTAAPRHYGSALLRATGSVQHLDELRQRFAERGLADWNAVRDAFAGESIGEEEIYRWAGLPFILPELREGHGEIQWANAGALPSPLEAAHIQGFLHAHTMYTDGTGTVEEMVVAAQEQGYRYIGISDHSQSAFYVNGLKEDRIRMQWAEIDAVQKTYPDIRILKGIEADILPDGTMDYADGLLAQFDFVIASVHSRFNLPEEQQTNRICRALANPYVTMLGHPTGRLLLSRAGYRVDLSQVIKTAAIHRKIIEINGSRHRLDLDWRWARIAKAHGVKFCINPDAHAVNELSNVSLGVNVARKAGLGRNDVMNTWTLKELAGSLRFRPDDLIEANVTPEGHAKSIRPMR